ncbi:Chromosome partition protein Smc [Rubripirellula lacrimiformis]|uniref:Chromosome partition protein Smc n=1 Tax=Rubripirellula lacrimiformis TaxID=1930273 RepID=A0A517N3K0_9BACT|nr:hypothetical protein [Rubripirellula lacrimiformis]QDT01717.1 Chromosome partition protein Smc [Rubripirellula lacrimiformis]
MIKKMILTGGVLALLSSVTLGVPLFSYARCGASWLTSSASDAVPLEWELKRARQMIADLTPEIKHNAKRIAHEKIQVASLQKQLDENHDRLAKGESDIQRLSEDLQNDSTVYSYGGRTYTSAQVKSDLGNRFKRFKTRQATAQKLDQMLASRQASLNAAHERMDAMLGAKRQLEVEVENLQARLGALRVAQTSSGLALDDSQLSQTRELLDAIATRIDVEEETMAVDVEYFGEINLDDPSEEDLLNEISSYFQGTGDESADAEALVSIQLN